MEEIWKDIKGYEGLYQVSNLGRVININRKTYKVIHINQKGYYEVALCKNGITKMKRIHNIIAKAFIPNPNNFRDVNHIDGNKLNNNISNLEWCSHLDNVRHAYRIGLITKEQIIYSTNKMKEACRKKIIQTKNGIIIKEFGSTIEASKELNIHPTCIHKNLKRKIKHTHGYIFYYKEKGN